jgi:DNA-binding NarL/FixJ family response regulator
MHILLLTDDPGDHALFEEAVGALAGGHTFTGCESIGEVWANIAAWKIPIPSLIFVDLELSRRYDNELFQILKSNVDLAPAPVVVFADFAEQEDVVTTYRFPVSCFVVFPRDRQLRLQKIQVCLDFWAKCAEVPELQRWWRDE